MRFRGMLVVSLGAWILVVAAVGPVHAQAVDFIFENAERPHITSTKEALELRAGPGQLRIPRLYQDFRLSFEFFLTGAEADGRVALRTWRPAGGPAMQYDFSLSRAVGDSVESLLVGPSGPAKLIKAGELSAAGPGIWRNVALQRSGRTVHLTIDNVLAGIYEAEDMPATVLFSASAGAVKIRRLSITTPVRTTDAAASLWDVLPRGDLKKVGLTDPEVLHEQKPEYTSGAMRRRVEGVVEVEAVILSDGTVGDVRVIRSLDKELDAKAVMAVYRWKFSPAHKDGQAVPVIGTVALTFCLRSC